MNIKILGLSPQCKCMEVCNFDYEAEKNGKVLAIWRRKLPMIRKLPKDRTSLNPSTFFKSLAYFVCSPADICCSQRKYDDWTQKRQK